MKSAVGLGNGVLTAFPLLAATHGAGALGAGLLFALRGAGALVGPLVMRPVLARPSWLLPGLALSMGLYGAGYLGVAFAPWFPLVLALVFVAHFGGGSNWVLSNFALQGEVPDALRGRVFATDMMLATLAIAISQLAASAVIVPGRPAVGDRRLRLDHHHLCDRLADRDPPVAYLHRADIRDHRYRGAPRK